MANERIKNALKQHGLRQWELAEIMGISEQTLSRRMRKEFPQEVQSKILVTIKEHTREGKKCLEC